MAKKRAQKAMSKLSVGATVRDWALRTDELPNVPRYFETGTELTRLPGPRSLFHARADQELPGCIRELTWELGHALNAACCLHEWLFGERGRPFFSEPTEAWNFAAHMLRLPNPMRRFDELFIASQATPPTFEGRTIEAFHREAFQILHSFSKWIIRGLLDAGFRSDATPDEWPVAFDEGIREHIEFLRRRNAATPFSWFNADELRRGLNRESILAQADEQSQEAARALEKAKRKADAAEAKRKRDADAAIAIGLQEVKDAAAQQGAEFRALADAIVTERQTLNAPIKARGRKKTAVKLATKPKRETPVSNKPASKMGRPAKTSTGKTIEQEDSIFVAWQLRERGTTAKTFDADNDLTPLRRRLIIRRARDRDRK